MKILPKGLILVGVPLIFGIAFISLLCHGLSEVNRLVHRQLMLKDARISYLTAARCTVAAARTAVAYKNIGDPVYKQVCETNEQQAAAANEHIKQLLMEDPSLPIPPLKLSKQQLNAFAPGNDLTKDLLELSKWFTGQKKWELSTTSQELVPLQRLSDLQTEAVFNAMNFLRTTLYGGILSGIVLSIFLAIFFCLSITNRLKKILSNTISLSRGTSLSPPIKGHDEIAELDQFLFKSATEIRELERFKRDMIGVVSQELEEPLHSVGEFFSSLGSGMYGTLGSKPLDKIERTSSSVKRLIGLIADLFFLDRLELEIHPREIAVDEIITASVDTVKELSERSGIEIVVKRENSSVFADRDRLIQVIVNFLSNAIKFSPPKGRITLEVLERDGWFECRVSDQGRGIPDAARKQVFEPFKQVDAKDATTKKGTGLGLTISRSIVEQHGGIIGVDSEEGKGSTFWYRIPATQSSSSNELRQVNQKVEQTEKLSPKMSKVQGKFSVLKQGLVIISVPLVFQLVFATVIVYMLEQISQHTQREENSQKMLALLNEVTDETCESIQNVIGYQITRDPEFSKSFQAGKDRVLAGLDRAKAMSTAGPEQAKDIEECRSIMDRFMSIINEQLPLSDNNQFQKFLKDPVHAPPSMIRRFQIALKDPQTYATFGPFLHAQKIQDRLMAREKAIGENLAAHRTKLISTLNVTLIAGIVVTIILSIILVIFLMRNLTSRLQHVMENTARIVKKEALDPPKGGSDEIAYLDQILFETGNHLIELQNFKQDLIAIVSHELRTPLMSVCSVLELLDAGILGELSEEGKIRLKLVEAEANRLVRLINDLLDIEKMEAGKFVLDKIEFKILDLIEPTRQAVEPLAEEKQIRLELDAADLELRLRADRDRLCQALINLLSYEIKSTPDNVTINMSVQGNNGEVEFRVIDPGRVIPEELRKKMFDRFVRVEDSQAAEHSGSGLTLAIAKAIVEQHGGTIGVDSEVGQGSTFWFKLPL